MSATFTHSGQRSLFAVPRRPSAREVEAYAQLIAQREGCPVEDCREQAELQLWATYPRRPGKLRLGKAIQPLGASLAPC